MYRQWVGQYGNCDERYIHVSAPLERCVETLDPNVSVITGLQCSLHSFN